MAGIELSGGRWGGEEGNGATEVRRGGQIVAGAGRCGAMEEGASLVAPLRWGLWAGRHGRGRRRRGWVDRARCSAPPMRARLDCYVGFEG